MFRAMDASYPELLETLAIPHRAKDAFWRLMAAGKDALPVVRTGLGHPNADVRQYCCKFLDHFVDSEGLSELVAMMDDAAPQVRVWAVHALSCDRCKENTCRPDEGLVLPRAIALLQSDPDVHVRNHAIGLIGLSVHHRPEAVAALKAAVAADPHPSVRKKAAWYAPGGAIYKRTAPKPARVETQGSVVVIAP